MKETFTDEQKQQATVLKSEIDAILEVNRDLKTGIESNFVEIGDRLATVRLAKFWKLWSFKNFSAFMASLEGRTQNYHCMGVARDLLPHVAKDDLVKMGISKATLLRLLIKGGKIPTAEMVTMAQDKTKEELEGAVAKELGLVEEEEKGPWFSFGGARLNDEEVEEFLRTVNIVIQAAALEGEAITNWQDVPSMRKKQIFHFMCAEFLATYASEVVQ